MLTDQSPAMGKISPVLEINAIWINICDEREDEILIRIYLLFMLKTLQF